MLRLCRSSDVRIWLKEIFELVYSENTGNHMISATAISRAIRAQVLVTLAVNCKMLSKQSYTEDVKSNLTEAIFFEKTF